MSRRRHRASSATAAAMPLQELEQWLQERAERRPVATSIAMLDGYADIPTVVEAMRQYWMPTRYARAG